MKATSIARKSTRTRWSLASIVLLIGLLTGYLASGFLQDELTDRPKPLAQLIRELGKQDTALARGWRALWTRLPSRARMFLVRFEPKHPAEVRLEACRALAQLRTESGKVIPALISALNDSILDVRGTAVQALGELGPLASAAQPELIRLFKHCASNPPQGRGRICTDTVVALAMISPADPVVFHLLKEALREKQTSGGASEFAVSAVSGLEKMDTAKHEVVSTLISALSDSDAILTYHILSALGGIRQQPETVVPILIEGLHSKDERVRRSAVGALGNFGSRAAPAVPTLIRLANEARDLRKSEQKPSQERPVGIDTLSEDQLIRYGLLPVNSSSDNGVLVRILPTLGLIGRAAKEAIPFLVEDYSDQANPLRFEEAFVRWQIDGDAAAVASVLLEGIRNPVFRARSAVIGRLKEMGTDAVPILKTAFLDGDSTVRLVAVQSLAQISPMLLLGPDLLRAGINDPNVSVRVAMIQALGACGVDALQAAPLLKPLLNDPKTVVRHVTGEALKRIQPASPAP